MISGRARHDGAARRLRRAVFVALEPTAAGNGLSPASAAVALLILVATVVAVAETEITISRGRERHFALAELGFGAIFLAEYAARVWASVENPRFAGSRWPRLRFAVTPMALIDLLATLPALIATASGGFLVLRSIRALRIVRFGKLGRWSEALNRLSRTLFARRFEFAAAGLLGAAAVLVSATLLYWAEGATQPEAFGSIPRALWWSVMTLTTVGYGDVYPITPLGKVLSGCVAVTGIGLIAMPTGILAAAFSDAVQGRGGREESTSSDDQVTKARGLDN